MFGSFSKQIASFQRKRYAATQAVGIVQSTSNSPQPHPLNNEATLDAYQPTVVLNNAVIEQLVVVDASAVECAEPFEVVADSGHTAEPDPQVDNELQLQQAEAAQSPICDGRRARAASSGGKAGRTGSGGAFGEIS